MRSSETIDELAKALAAAQAEMPEIHKDAHAEVKTRTGADYEYTYATLALLLGKVRPVLARHGLSLLQGSVGDTERSVTVETRLLHSSGQWLESALTLPAPSPRPQDLGSLITYSRRYQLCAMLGLAPDEDDDGKAAQDAAPARPAAPRAANGEPEGLDDAMRFGKFRGTTWRAAMASEVGYFREYLLPRAERSLDDPAKAQYRRSTEQQIAMMKWGIAQHERTREPGEDEDAGGYDEGLEAEGDVYQAQFDG